MTRRVLARAALLALLAAALLPGAPAASGSVGPCPTLTAVPGVGPACLAPNGLLAVYGPTGDFLGYTHGADALPSSVGLLAAPKPPACVSGSVGDAYVRVIYARAFDDADQYASLVGTIRSLVDSANGMVADAANATGGVADIKVLCAGGVVVVANETLPTAKASASFSTIVNDLRAKGYTSRDIKNWVFYDDTAACSCAGTGHLYLDDSPLATNANNGAVGTSAMFAVDFGYTGAQGARTFMHELGHTLGAVQNSAPHSSGAGHCWDGKDTMCYNDGGPNAGLCTPDFYCSNTCATEAFDCGHDDYFHRNPAAGSYLSTHWNIGNVVDRFLSFGIPAMRTFSCSPVIGVSQDAGCTMSAADDSSGVRYDINWGDGATSCAPTCASYVPPGVTQTASHRFASGGSKGVNVTATDNGTPAQSSSAMGAAILVDAQAPVSTLTLTGTRDAASGWFRSAVSLRVTATDAGGAGVNASFLRVDGGPWGVPFANVTTDGVHAARYYSTDKGDNAEAERNVTFLVDRAPPTGRLALACAPCVQSVGLSWNATDAGSGLRSARVTWEFDTLNGATSGDVCASAVSGAAAEGSCAFSGWLGVAPGTYCFTLVATDQAGNVSTTAPACADLV